MEDDLFIMTSDGVVIRMAADTIRLCGRASQGVILVRLDNGAHVIDVALTEKEEDEPETTEEGQETEGAESAEETPDDASEETEDRE